VTMKVQPFALLLGRVALGVVFVAHGWQKFSGTGLDGTAAFFEQVGVPAAQAAAVAAAVVELAGGLAMIVGALLPVAGMLLGARVSNVEAAVRELPVPEWCGLE
jgi:putative oxidoreductase